MGRVWPTISSSGETVCECVCERESGIVHIAENLKIIIIVFVFLDILQHGPLVDPYGPPVGSPPMALLCTLYGPPMDPI
jgi:hypothetical protein